MDFFGTNDFYDIKMDDFTITRVYPSRVKYRLVTVEIIHFNIVGIIGLNKIQKHSLEIKVL